MHRLQTYTTIINFIAAMALHPECQERAQREIDEVVGHDRLPEMTDRPELPYVNAVLKETMRWCPITPQGV